MVKIIDEKKFLEELNSYGKPSNVSDPYSWIEKILSKHLRDLPKRKKYPMKSMPWVNTNEWRRGFNQCLEDCKK